MGSEHLFSLIAAFSRPAVFILLIACGLGAPLSEELILVTAGLVVAHGHGHLWTMMATAFVGTLAGDLALYRIGRKVGPKALEHKKLRKLLTPKRVAWIEGHFHKNGPLTIFLARFLPGLRAATFLVAGVSRFRMRNFVLADALGALISAPLLTWLGYRFGVSVLKDIKVASRWVLLGVAALIVVLMVRKMIQRKRRLASGAPDVAVHMLEKELEQGAR